MRILMVSHLYPSRADSVNGSFVHSQVKALAEMGCQVKVLAPVAYAPFPLYLVKEKWRRFQQTPRRDDYQGVEVEYPRIIRTPRAVFFTLAGWNYYLALKKRALAWHRDQPFDLVHAQVAYPDGWAAARLAAEMGLPLVLTLHGQELQKIVRWGEKLKKMVLATLAQSRGAVVPSPKMRALAESYGVNPGKLHLVPNGLDPLPPGVLPREVGERIAGKKVLLSVGRLEREKGFQHNIQALALLAAKHPDLVYVLVGEGAFRRDLEELAQSLELGDRVIFAGYQPRERVGAYYANSHLFSMPSRDESFGIVYLEAMAAGLPLIGARGEGAAPLIEESGAGRLVSFGAVQDLADNISALLDPALGAVMGDKGRKAAAEFTWEKSALKLLAVYREVLA
jgi:glycosyltransferase involved in cell wall biosynthesis